MSLPSEITTSDGVKLSLKELDPGDMLDLIEAAGSAMGGQSSGAWLGYAQMICSVNAIDGVPVHMPSTKGEVKELARRIGNLGIVALQPVFYGSISQKEGASSAADEKEAAKN